MWLLFAATFITSLVSLGLALASKRENDEDFKNVNDSVSQAGNNAISKINEATKLITSETELVRVGLKESYSKTIETIEKLNIEISNNSTELTERLMAMRNPLSNLNVKLKFEVDFSEVSQENYLILEDFKTYLNQLGDYYKVLEMCHYGRLPRMLILNYESDNILRIKNPNCQFNPFNKNNLYDLNFVMKENKFIKLFLPSVFFFLKSDKKAAFNPKYESDLLFSLIGDLYTSKEPSILNYSIDFSKKTVTFNVVCESPNVLIASGKVNSVYDCSSGVIGIGFDYYSSLKIRISNFDISFGEIAKVEKRISLLFDDERRFDVSLNQAVFYNLGKEL